MKALTFSAAMSVSCTISMKLYRRPIGTLRFECPQPTELQERIEERASGRGGHVDDLTGGGDHFRAEIVSDSFEGLSRIQQHKLVYDVFGDEIGGPIHALSIKTSTPGGPA